MQFSGTCYVKCCAEEHPEMINTSGNTEESAEEKLLSDFYRSLGIRSFTAGGVFWYSIGLRLYTPVPCNRYISLSTHDLSSIWSQGALFVFFPSADNRLAFPGYVYVVEDKNYGFTSIKSGDRRHNIRRAFKHCSVENIPFELLWSPRPQLEKLSIGKVAKLLQSSRIQSFV